MQRRHQVLLFLNLFFLLLLALVTLRKQENSATSPNQQGAEATVVQDSQSKALDQLMAGMSLEEKIGQLFFARVPAAYQLEDLQAYHLGGYILFGQDIDGQTPESLRETLQAYQAASAIPLLIGSDEEGGAVTRVSSLLENPFRAPKDIYQEAGMAGIVEDTQLKAQTLNNLGIKAGLFPVADIAQNSSSFIYNRTLGQDLETTKAYIAEVVKTLDLKQSGSTLKHFPGYGDNEDSHTDIVYDHRSLADLEAYDFQVFQAGIDAGADSILVAHNIVPAIDQVPASISPEVTAILREKMGFDGVIMTDDMDMAGLADFISQEEAAYQVLLAGNDMIMSSQYALQIPYLLDKVATGELTEERIDQSLRRVLQWKVDLGLLQLD